MRTNEAIQEIEVDGYEVHLIDQSGLIIGIVLSDLNVYKLDGNELIKINETNIINPQREIKIKSGNRIKLIKK